MRSSGQQPQKLTLKQLVSACEEQGGQMITRLYENLKSQPDAIALLAELQTEIRNSSVGGLFKFTDTDSRTLDEVMTASDLGDHMRLLAMAERRLVLHLSPDNRMQLLMAKWIVLTAIVKYALLHEGNPTADRCVATWRECGSEEDKHLLSALAKWSANSKVDSLAVMSDWLIAAGARLFERKQLDEAQSIAETEQQDLVKLIERMEGEPVTIPDQLTMLVCLEQLRSSDEFQILKTSLPVLPAELDAFLTSLPIQFNDQDFELSLMGYKNSELFKVATKLENCLSCIDEFIKAIETNTKLYTPEKLKMMRMVYQLHQAVQMRKRQLSDEMFQRLHYFENDIIPDLHLYGPDHQIICPSSLLNTLKYELIKKGKYKLGEFKKDHKLWVTQTIKAALLRDRELDVMTPEQIAKYILYVSEVGSAAQAAAVQDMIPVNISTVPAASMLTLAVVHAARDKKIFHRQSQYKEFCNAAIGLYGEENGEMKAGAFNKMVNLAKNKRDFTELLDVRNIKNPHCREIAFRLLASPVCDNLDIALAIITKMNRLDGAPMLQSVLGAIMLKFTPLTDRQLASLIFKLMSPDFESGKPRSDMFFYNCLQHASSLEEFIYRVDREEAARGDHAFVYLLLSHLEENQVRNLIMSLFSVEAKDDEMMSGACEIGELIDEQYRTSLNIAARYMRSVMHLPEGRDAKINETVIYCVILNKFFSTLNDEAAKISAAKMQESLNAIIAIMMLLKKDNLMLASTVLLQLTDKFDVGDKVVDMKVDMRQVFPSLLRFICNVKGLEFEDAIEISHKVFDLYMVIKAARDIHDSDKFDIMLAMNNALKAAVNENASPEAVERIMMPIAKKYKTTKFAGAINELSQKITTALSTSSQIADAQSPVARRAVVRGGSIFREQPAPQGQPAPPSAGKPSTSVSAPTLNKKSDDK